MKQREIEQSGQITNSGQLKMYMGELNQFFAMHKGCRVVARFSVVSGEPSELLKHYYFNYVVPAMRRAFWENGERMTKEQTEERLRQISPIMCEQSIDTKTGKYETRLLKVTEIGNPEFLEHIETIKQFAAENFGVYIHEPKQII